MNESLYQIAKDNDLDFVKADFYRFKRTDEDDMNMVYNRLSKNPEDYNKVFNPSEDTEAIRYIMNTWSGIYKKEFIEKHHIRHNDSYISSLTKSSGSTIPIYSPVAFSRPIFMAIP